jgi:hypothetical protein
MTASYLGAFDPTLPITHQIRIPALNEDGTEKTSNHGNVIYTFGPPISRFAICFYPLHKIPHHDTVSSDYVARTMIDFIMEVPDANLFTKDDLVTYRGLKYTVEGFPFNWGDDNPFGMDGTMFGGSVHILRVT